MFEDTNINAVHTDRLFGRMKLVVVQAVADGTNWILDAPNSSRGLAITPGGTTSPVFTGIDKGLDFWLTKPEVINSVITARVTVQDPANGTITVLTSAVTNGVRMMFFFYVSRQG